MPRKKSEHKREALSRSSSRSKGKRKRKSKSRSPSPLARLAVIERATEHAKAIRNLRNKASKRESNPNPQWPNLLPIASLRLEHPNAPKNPIQKACQREWPQYPVAHPVPDSPST